MEREELTQVIQGAWSSPNAARQAGSRDWKNSSGWKKVRTVQAFTRRKATRKRKMRSEDGGVERRKAEEEDKEDKEGKKEEDKEDGLR